MRIAQWKVLFWFLVGVFVLILCACLDDYEWKCNTDSECVIEELERGK